MHDAEPTELELKMFAFHDAMCDVFADVTAELVVLRTILYKNGTVSDAEFQRLLSAFGQDRLASHRKEIAERIYSLAKRKLKPPGRVQ